MHAYARADTASRALEGSLMPVCDHRLVFQVCFGADPGPRDAEARGMPPPMPRPADDGRLVRVPTAWAEHSQSGGGSCSGGDDQRGSRRWWLRPGGAWRDPARSAP